MAAPAEHMEIEDLETFQVLKSPLRLRILRHLLDPKTVKDVAGSMNVPPTRLYYHFNLLQSVGVIEVVDTQKVGAIMQKVYRARARGFRPSKKLVAAGHSPTELARMAASVVLDGAKVDAEAALSAHFERISTGEESDPGGSLGRTVAFFSADRAARFREELARLLEIYFEDDRVVEGVEYSFSHAFFPMAGTDPDAAG